MDTKLDTMQQPAAQVGASLSQQVSTVSTASKDMGLHLALHNRAHWLACSRISNCSMGWGCTSRSFWELNQILIKNEKKMAQLKVKELKVRKSQDATIQQKIKLWRNKTGHTSIYTRDQCKMQQSMRM